MNCVINESIDAYIKQGKDLDEIQCLILLNHHINIDIKSIKERIKLIQLDLAIQH
ncbi:hypothetical protein BH23BAC1_BH23BAC1_02390 [soil metagenome]